jgi:hypothetical protein
MLQIAECSIRISDKMHRSNIISYPVKCKQKYAIDGLISRSTRTLKVPAEVPVLHTRCLLSGSYYSVF